MEKLVSIITPCYNGEQYINRYAESILEQDYHNCQLIFMDDGSTDKTKELIMGYETKFLENGIHLEYHFHENAGVGATIADGIKYVRGEYFIFPDVDDVLAPKSIKKKYDFLETNPQYGLVRTNFSVALDQPDNIIRESGTAQYKNKNKENLFKDYLVSQNMWLQPGCYMIRSSAYDIANPDRYIYPARTGQNWQLLLPVLYTHKCGYLDDRLYIYILRSNSLSNSMKGDFNRERNQLIKYVELINETISHMNIEESEKKKYCQLVENYYTQQQIALAYRFGNKEWATENWQKLPHGHKNLKTWIKKTFAGNEPVKHIISSLTGK